MTKQSLQFWLIKKLRRNKAYIIGILVTLLNLGLTMHSAIAQVSGIVWQPENSTFDPRGNWEKIGAHQLLIQWTVVDNTSFVKNSGVPEAPQLPDWSRIATEPWAREVILGLAGYFDEVTARSKLEQLIPLSNKLAKLSTPLNVVGWYFPVEIDPTWQDAPRLASMLKTLPRPLWISVYDSANIGPTELAKWLAEWLPLDVGIFFQDGVGVHAREPHVAIDYLDALEARLGHKRVRVIAEAFRPAAGGGFRPATTEELGQQLQTYKGRKLFLFDGPHYLSNTAVDALKNYMEKQPSR